MQRAAGGDRCGGHDLHGRPQQLPRRPRRSTRRSASRPSWATSTSSCSTTQKPITVANFLKYVREGRFDTTIIHRATQPTHRPGGHPGRRVRAADVRAHRPTDAGRSRTRRRSIPVLSNTRGTIAMARTSGAQQRHQRVVHQHGGQHLARPRRPQPPGLRGVRAGDQQHAPGRRRIQALPTFQFGGAFGEIPLRNYTQTDFTPAEDADRGQLRLRRRRHAAEAHVPGEQQQPVRGHARRSPTTRSRLQYGSSTGTADVTVTATDAQGQSVTQTFTATVTAPPELAVTLGGTSGAAVGDLHRRRRHRQHRLAQGPRHRDRHARRHGPHAGDEPRKGDRHRHAPPASPASPSPAPRPPPPSRSPAGAATAWSTSAG